MTNNVVYIFIVVGASVCLAVLYYLFFRLRRLFSSPKNAQKTTHFERQPIRKIYFQPISIFAKKAHVEWNQQDLLNSGRWAYYMNGYLLPYLTVSDKIFTIIHCSEIISVDCLLDMGAIYPYRFYLKDGNVVDFIKEREILKELKPVKIIGYKEKLCNPRLLCILLTFF